MLDRWLHLYHENVKREVTELVDFLRNPEQYRKLSANIPRGVLLMGLPVTGKTLLAWALAKMNASRPSIRSSPKWMASAAMKPSLYWRRPTGRTCWTPPCSGPAALTATSPSICRTAGVLRRRTSLLDLDCAAF